MIVAASLNSNQQCISFESADLFGVFEVSEKADISEIEVIDVSQCQRCKSSFVPTLTDFNVDIFFTEKVESGAKFILHSYGIKIEENSKGLILEVLKNYFAGK
jgi:predicted Fe-Mo cluster-binding NifX family protein